MANKVGTHRPKSASALSANILYKKVPAHLNQQQCMLIILLRKMVGVEEKNKRL